LFLNLGGGGERTYHTIQSEPHPLCGDYGIMFDDLAFEMTDFAWLKSLYGG
jgi:hypothetical protein